MAGDVIKEFLVSILTRYDDRSEKEALESAAKAQDKITDREKRGADTRNKNLANSLADGLKHVQGYTKSVAQLGERVAVSLIGVATAVEGAAVSGTFALARLSKEMSAAYYAGQKLSSSVSDMNAFTFASEQAGSSAAKAQAGLEELGRLKNTNPAAYVGLLQRLGVAATDAAGKLRAPAEAAMDLGPALARQSRQMQLLFGNQLGMDDDQTLAMVRPEFLAQIAQYREMQKKIGFDPEKAAADGAAFQRVWTTMWTAVDLVAKKVQAAFFDQVGGSVDHVTDWLVKNSGRISDMAIKVGGYVLHLATSIVDLIANFDKLDPTVQRFVEILGGLAGALLILRAGPIGIIIALAGALATLWDDYEKYRQGLPSVVDWAKWEPEIKAAIKGLTDLWNKFDELALKVTGQGGAQVAFEGFAALIATTWVARILTAFNAVSGGWAAMLLKMGFSSTGAFMAAAGLGAAYLANNTANPLGGGRDMSWGEGALRFLDPGAADRIYGKSGEQQVHGPHHGLGVHAQPKDRRNLWQRRPTWLGGQEAPDGDVPTGAHTALKDLISQHETGTTGSAGYDTVYGHAERGGPLAPPKPVTQMTIAEILAYQHEMKPRSGALAFPVGRAQWVEKTLRGLTRGMDPNTVFSPEVQEKLFDTSIRQRLGQGPAGFRSEWDSLRRVGDAEIQAAINSHRTAMSAAPAPSGPIGDQAALDAETRARSGRAQAGDAALLKAYREQQNTPAESEREADGTLKQKYRTFGRYIKVTKPLFASRSIGGATNPNPGQSPGHMSTYTTAGSDGEAYRTTDFRDPKGTPKVEVVKQPLDPARQTLADAMNAVSAGTKAIAKIPSLHHPLGVTPSLYQAYDQRRTAQHSAAVHQDIKIHGVQSPHDIGSHLKVHAKRGIQDAIRTMQGQSG